jgi:hypothetical protein
LSPSNVREGYADWHWRISFGFDLGSVFGYAACRTMLRVLPASEGTMGAGWSSLYLEGVERHRALLSEAAAGRGRRLVSERGKPGPSKYCGIAAGAWPREAPARERVPFTVREWRRLILLRWRFRLGLLTD